MILGNKIFIALSLALLLSGCETTKKIVYKEVPYPVYVVPAPPEIERPVLQIHKLTDEQKAIDGEILKAERASVVQLLSYIDELELIVGKYRELSVESSKNLDRLKLPVPMKLNDASETEWRSYFEPKEAEK